MKNPILSILLICQGLSFQQAAAQISTVKETRIVLEHDGWQLVGDLLLPIAEHSVPAVLLLNQAAGNRTVYKMLANHLADKGIASLRLDLRGHGESTNVGRFVPGESQSRKFIWEADADIVFAHEYLLSHSATDTDRIGIVGASYSGRKWQRQAGSVATPGCMWRFLQVHLVKNLSLRSIPAKCRGYLCAPKSNCHSFPGCLRRSEKAVKPRKFGYYRAKDMRPISLITTRTCICG